MAIESAIAGGSIALFKGKDFISGASGGDSVSRAEDLLPQIIHLLKKAGVERNAIDRIAISLGPGSYTGLRIGIATVLGLSRGLGIEHVGVPVFEAISDFYENCPGLIALPMGRSDICVVEDESRDARITSLDALKTELEIAPHPRYFAHSEIVPSFIEICPEVIDIGTNLARFVGTAALRRPKGSGLEPIYVQNPRFG